MYDALKAAMEKHHIKAYSLAKQASIDASSLYSALAGKREMYPNWRARISEALREPENELFPESNMNNQKVGEQCDR